jgi:hypothetical protein
MEGGDPLFSLSLVPEKRRVKYIYIYIRKQHFVKIYFADAMELCFLFLSNDIRSLPGEGNKP